MIKNICLINNYNNQKFISDCLDSVFTQTHPFDQVIIVDDGSTDNSLQIIDQFLQKYTHLKLLKKINEGQFSTFNAALTLLPDKAQIFLLDGDDIFPRDYLEQVLRLVRSQHWDFAFCEQQKFMDGALSPTSVVIGKTKAHKFSVTSALTRSRQCWIGAPTSCLSLSSDLYKKIFPYPHIQDKSFWADNLMIYAASILGAKKIFLSGIGIGWRVHASNDSKKTYSSEDIEARERAINRAFDWYCSKYQIPRYPGVVEFFREYKLLGDYWRKRLDLPGYYRMLNRLVRARVKQLFRS
ncbi:glycosyltransferase [Polynucleobacter sp. MWH-UH19D]|uniref:glycosyltransferase family 2 protein n=1 Tax=Polynucleobacter sp. MWH-UH19D TaxID=1855610 RepID=UPI003364B4FB